ncbi:MFS general substrate transporter [Aspergillus fijiensis CBS 313.89]|uniref:MFS general substrate transporter n=1 Tax=Aspergillus fijiensis CBS 313.89 TaxID=1448319 RepID=A0A8G1RXH9_9EURO|nr:MFS general substrate transporter [Aspergillus fijiensis CBS 313.89]RAK81365.1 MFS general substrate transporter [Aspergillus fijiensis CBS 313.89]
MAHENTLEAQGGVAKQPFFSSSEVTLTPPYCVISTPRKIFIITLTSLAMIATMIATNIVLPVLPILQQNYGVSTTQMNLLVTVFSLVQGITPALMSSLSDLQGRRLAWMLTLALYTAANIGLALQNSYPALIILRCLQSLGSSCAIPFGFAVAADISSPAERGRYIGPLQGCVMGAFAFGPVIGGLLEPAFGWRSIFWFLGICSGSALLAYFVVIPETARSIVGDGSVEPVGWWRRPLVQNVQRGLSRDRDSRHTHTYEKDPSPTGGTEKRRIDTAEILRAFTLLGEKDALILVIFTSLFYAGVTAMWATTGSHFANMYRLSTLEVGFSFLPYGIAGAIGSILSGRVLDFNYTRIQTQLRQQTRNLEDPSKDPSGDDPFPYECARLQIAVPFALLASVSLLSYGWIIQTHCSLAAALVFQSLIGFSGTPLLGIIYTLLIDLYPTQAVATQGAADLVRCWLGALFAAVIDYMIESMGWGWSFTILGLNMVIAMPLLGVLYLYGPKWRKRKQERVKAGTLSASVSSPICGIDIQASTKPSE